MIVLRTRIIMRWFQRIATGLAVLALWDPSLGADGRSRSDSSPAEVMEWRAYGHDYANTKYSPLDQIHAGNVDKLKTAWQWQSVDQKVARGRRDLGRHYFEVTPLMVGGILYVRTSLSLVAAVDAATGRTLWSYDPESYDSGRPAIFGFVSRGLAYWSDGADERIIYVTGDGRLIALKRQTGQRVETFGTNGAIDLKKNARRFNGLEVYTVSSPPVVCRDVIVVGSAIKDGRDYREMPGDVRGFDVRTGKELWVFHSVPGEGEYGVDTWENDSWRYSGNTNAWSIMSADEELGYVYLPFSTPTHNWYGGHRLGDNLFGESLVCLEAKTGRRVWHYQIVHHGLWDYDLASAPNLVDITVDGKKIRAVAQATKHGFCFVFDRVTGEPVWPIEERPVPASNIEGERTSDTQPFPSKPAPFERQGVTMENLIDFTPELRSKALEALAQFDSGELFTPPSERGILLLPGIYGGANWEGAAFDPETGILYIPSVTLGSRVQLERTEQPSRYGRKSVPLMLNKIQEIDGPLQGLPLFKPPYGRITAIDLNTGEHVWMKPHGNGPRDHSLLRPLELGPLGSGARGVPLLTKSLLFVGEDALSTFFGYNGEKKLRAFDKATGEVVWERELAHYPNGAPMTYMVQGKQYLVVALGGHMEPDSLLALRLE